MPRWVAVETEMDDRLKGRAAFMLWDTRTEEIVGNQVYDVEEMPVVGDLASWDIYTASYAGP